MTLASMTGFARRDGTERARALDLGGALGQRPAASTCACACRPASTPSTRHVRAGDRPPADARQHHRQPRDRDRARPRRAGCASTSGRSRRRSPLPRSCVAAHGRVRRPRSTPSSAMRGVARVPAEAVPERGRRAGASRSPCSAGFDQALAALVAARREEGAAIGAVVGGQIDRDRGAAPPAPPHPDSRRPVAIRARLRRAGAPAPRRRPSLDPERLHQEAVMIATARRRAGGDRPPRRPRGAGSRAPSERRARSAAGSTSSPRNMRARPTRCARRPATRR